MKQLKVLKLVKETGLKLRFFIPDERYIYIKKTRDI